MDRTLQEEALDLLERINTDLKGHSLIDTINTKMVSVVKDLNEVRICEITGKEIPKNNE
jgi:hypothetical protein